MAKSLSILSSWGFLGLAFGNLALGLVVMVIHFTVMCVRASIGPRAIPFKHLIGSVIALSTDNSYMRFPSLSLLVMELLLPGSAFGAMAAVMAGDAGSVVGGVVAIACVAAAVVLRQLAVVNCFKLHACVVPYSAAVRNECKRLHLSVVHSALLPTVHWEPTSVRMAFGCLFQRYHSERNALYFSGVTLVLSITMSLAAPMAVPFGFCNELAVVAAMLLCGVSVAYALKRPERCATDNIFTSVMYLILGAMMVLSIFSVGAASSRQWLQLFQWGFLLLKVLSFAAVAYWERTMTRLVEQQGETTATGNPTMVEGAMNFEKPLENKKEEPLLCSVPVGAPVLSFLSADHTEVEVDIDSLQILMPQALAAEDLFDWSGSAPKGMSMTLDYDYYQDCLSQNGTSQR